MIHRHHTRWWVKCTLFQQDNWSYSILNTWRWWVPLSIKYYAVPTTLYNCIFLVWFMFIYVFINAHEPYDHVKQTFNKMAKSHRHGNLQTCATLINVFWCGQITCIWKYPWAIAIKKGWSLWSQGLKDTLTICKKHLKI